MSKRLLLFVMTLLSAALVALPAAGQKGTGEATGMARRAAKPPIERFSGTITDVKIGPCKTTTGRSTEGAHLIVQTPESRILNVHLGPPAALAAELKTLKTGVVVSVEAFRTDRLPADAWVARTVTAGDKSFTLRDANLRPKWARGRGGGWGDGGGGLGRGFGPGSCFW